MATRLYLHNATSTEAGTLPTAKQAARTATQSFESQTINHTLDTTIGVAQAALTFTNTTNLGNNFSYYVAKFISAEINQAGIAANTWRYNFASKQPNNATVDDFPTLDTNHTGPLPITVYVWRPSNGTKVGNIFDANQTGYYDAGNFGNKNTNEVAEDGTFAGAAVASATTGDVIVLEAWISVWTTSSTSTILSFFYDGTTETLTGGTTVSNHASFLETPENITFAGGAPPATPTFPLYRSFSPIGFLPAVASRTF